MALTKKQRGSAFHGLKMLLYQGIIAYELWNKLSVSEEMALEVYCMLQEKMEINV